MGWLQRLWAAPSAPAAATTDTLAGLTRQFTDAGVANAERVARRAAAAGLAPDHIKRTATARFIVFRAPDADQVKRFLLDDLTVDMAVTYFVVETPDGNWCKDIDGLYLENLLPWQRDIAAAEYVARIITLPAFGHPSGSFLSASQGIMDNFTVEVKCGRCQAQWWDGVRYADFTAVRCPACRSLNRVDSRGYTATHYVSPTPADPPVRPAPNEPLGQLSPLTAAELADPRRVAARLEDLIDSMAGTADRTTEAQRQLSIDVHYLDTRLASGEPLEEWVRANAEVRAIGYHLDRVGGMELMQRVDDALDPREHLAAVSFVSYLWDRIGQWRA